MKLTAILFMWFSPAGAKLLGRQSSKQVILNNGDARHPSLDAAVSAWQDVASKTYVKESAKAIRHMQRSGQDGGWFVKPAFVFMIYHELNFARLWEAYFRAAKPDSFRVLVHASEHKKASQVLTPFFKERLVTGVPDGKWCHFSKTQLALIRMAFADESITHLVWLSADSVPLQRMESIITSFSAPQVQSFFCVDHVSWARAEMWTLLARPHALTIAQNEKLLYDLYERYEACEDEAVFYEPLRLLGACFS
eukprot:gnl/MRDRNA2_/MRDRNA2_39001_c0_seq2.p1 gnl/MRDRNA2_/MRDRNA2_39001_c0~~gnl/MRDRNA2_/MRDRNA2_39001_c0_seq2.p1  ORF type:complete len:251 (-),score=41.48 gnl/MRDRNA2_/MRDRNA2_39001_c0_seq2:280-1032(-)